MTLIRRPALRLLALSAALALQACSGPSDTDLLASAKTYLAQKDNKSAILQLKAALQQSPQSAEARYLLGKALLDGGEPATAVVELQKAADLKYAPALVTPALASALLLTGETHRVTDTYDAVALDDPGAQASLKTTLAQAWAQQGKQDKADAALAAALAASPQYVPAQLMQAQLRAARQDYAGALALLASVTQADPANAEAWLLQGEVQQYGLRDREAALASFRKAAGLRNELMAAHRGIVALLVDAGDLDGARAHVDQLKKTQPAQFVTQLLDAQMAFLAKDYAATRAIVQPLVAAAPNNALVLQLAGAAEFFLRALPQAEGLLARAVKLAPGLPLASQLLARTYLRTGQPEKALDVLKPLVEAPAPLPSALTLAGEAYLQAGDGKRAEEMFTRATKVRPDDARARTALALGQIGKGNAAAGLAALESVAAADGGEVAALALIATHLRRNEVDKALLAVDALERKQPERPLAANLRGRILAGRGDAAGARRSFERALSLDAAFYPAIASLAALDMAERKPDAARQRFEALLKSQPQDHRAMLALASIEARVGDSPRKAADWLERAVKAAPSEVAPRVQLVNHLLSAGDPKAALVAAQAAVTAVPGSRDLVALLGRTQLASGDFQQAVTSFNKLASLQPRSPAAAMGLAEANAGLKNYDAAERHLRQALEITPDFLPAQRALVGMMLADDRPADAVAVARQVQKQRPTAAAGFQLEGDIELRRRAWDAALAAYRTGLQKEPSAESAIKLHVALRTAGRADEADRFGAGWLKDHARDAAFRFYLGDIALAAGDLPRAEARYRDVLAVQADNALALNNVAWLMVKQGKPGALALAEKAVTLLPNRAPLLDTLALALAAEQQLPRALELQRKTLEAHPQDPTLRLTLARLYLKAGDKAKARTELESLAKLGKSFAGQAEVAELMAGT